MKQVALCLRAIGINTSRGRMFGEVVKRYLFLELVVVLLYFCLAEGTLQASAGSGGRLAVNRIRKLVDRFRRELSITDRVTVSIVASNERLVSVERSKEPRGGFILSFDENFLNTLEDKELQASIAHELGHVWIFTHHPYLQTELLANQIALRVVNREQLEKVYVKVWKEKGVMDLKDFLGEDTAVGLKPNVRIKSLPRQTDSLSR